MGAVDDEHELQIDMLLRSNRCDRTRELSGAVCLREHNDSNLVLGFTANTFRNRGPHLLRRCGRESHQNSGLALLRCEDLGCAARRPRSIFERCGSGPVHGGAPDRLWTSRRHHPPSVASRHVRVSGCNDSLSGAGECYVKREKTLTQYQKNARSASLARPSLDDAVHTLYIASPRHPVLNQRALPLKRLPSWVCGP